MSENTNVTIPLGKLIRWTIPSCAPGAANVRAVELAVDAPTSPSSSGESGKSRRPVDAAYAHLDVAVPDEWDAAVAKAVDEFGGLDILVNNAGMGDLATIEETTLEDWERTVAIDQTGVFLGMKHAADALKASGSGTVVNISSIFGTSGGFGSSPACHAAKGAVRTLTKNVALHWATEGVRVNSVHPGFIDTPLMDQARGTPFEQAMIDLTPMGRFGRHEEIAAGVAYLASDDAAFRHGARALHRRRIHRPLSTSRVRATV